MVTGEYTPVESLRKLVRDQPDRWEPEWDVWLVELCEIAHEVHGYVEDIVLYGTGEVEP